MIVYLVGALVLLILAAGFLLASTPSMTGGNSTELDVDPDEESESALTYTEALSRPRRTVEFETHPLEQIKMLSTKLSQYEESALRQIEDPELSMKFQESIKEIGKDLGALDPESIVTALVQFPPVQNSYHFTVDPEFIGFLETISDLLYALPSNPRGVFHLEHYARALRKSESDLRETIHEYHILRKIQLTQELTNDLVSNDVKILSSLELCETELEKFFEFFFALKAFLTLEPVIAVRLEETCMELDQVLSILHEVKVLHTKEHIQNLQRLQKSLLPKLRSFCTHYQRLLGGILVGLEIMCESNLRDLVNQAELLEGNKHLIEEELIPTTESFAIGHGTMESDFHKYFQKLMAIPTKGGQPEAVSVGTIESSIAYFEQRGADLRSMVNSKPVKAVYNIFSGILGRIKRHS